MSVQSWKPKFDPLADKICHMALWVRLPYHPFKYYNSSMLACLGNLLEKTLKIDRTTKMANRGRFACICVEVDASKGLIPKLIVGGRIQHVEYKVVGTICFHCGCIGRRDTYCDKMDKNVEDMNGNNNQRNDCIPTETTNVEEAHQYKGKYGLWLMVQHRKTFTKENPKKSSPASHFVKGNAFKVLDSIGNMDEEQDMISQVSPRSEEALEKMDVGMIAKQDNIASSSKSGSLMALANVSNLQVQRIPLYVAIVGKGKSQGYKGA
ncbi:uncharacterized protein LOC132804560 [Ziziphus jujuba]|uniref:Uncharacterized protein LOC132804560 n=1 Tax=Ziziphus jujuba TaxID=326968 RepID=A0ABM4AEQ2_ZIZJJ|nr:uncharacterized protein LOC132804560 [Ziziphus jujuba]